MHILLWWRYITDYLYNAIPLDLLPIQNIPNSNLDFDSLDCSIFRRPPKVSSDCIQMVYCTVYFTIIYPAFISELIEYAVSEICSSHLVGNGKHDTIWLKRISEQKGIFKFPLLSFFFGQICWLIFQVQPNKQHTGSDQTSGAIRSPRRRKNRGQQQHGVRGRQHDAVRRQKAAAAGGECSAIDLQLPTTVPRQTRDRHCQHRYFANNQCN